MLPLSFGEHHGHRVGVFRMVSLLRCCIFGLLSLSVLTAEAARQKPVVRPASAQDTFVKGQGTSGQTTLDIDRHWGEILDVPGGRTTVPVVQKSAYNATRIAGILKNAIKSTPAKYAATAAVTYLISELPDAGWDGFQLTRTPTVTTPVTLWAVQGFVSTHSCAKQASASGALDCYVGYNNSQPGNSSVGFFWRSNHVTTHSPTSATGYYDTKTPSSTSWSLNSGSIVLTSYQGCQSAGQPVACSSGNPVPFTDSDYDQLVSNVPNFSPEFWGELGPELLADVPATFDGPDYQEFTGLDQVTGTPTITTTLDQVSGTTTVVESTPVHSFDYSTSPLSITTTTTTTTNTYQNGTLVSTTTQTQGQPSPEVSDMPEIPTDCDFMPTVCSFIEWVKSPFTEQEPDLSEFISDEDFEKEINFSSNATCPAPSMIDTSHGAYEFSWEPACQWAGMVKPLVIIAALIGAIFINLGMARGNE